jgi:catechol 2,3-dioxygenase-like lactoylglutathione lyase family enzyme
MARLLLNIDVPNLAQGIAFYTAALGLRVGRHFDDAFVELIGGDFPIYLLEKDAGTPSGPAGGEYRRYDRHWSPVHADFVVENIEAAILRVLSVGAIQEGEKRIGALS